MALPEKIFFNTVADFRRAENVEGLRFFKVTKPVWIEIDRKEQSSYSDALGDEVTSFLRRYGVRTLRV